MDDDRKELESAGGAAPRCSRRAFLQAAARTAGVGAGAALLGPALVGRAAALAAPARRPAPVGNLLLVQGVDAESLDPHVTTSGASKGMMWAMYDKLLERSPEMRIIPWLATSYRVLNETTWEFRLRDNVFFHNGEKFGAEHVRDTIARFKHPGIRNVYAGQLAPVKDVEVVNPLTVRIHTDGPFALLADVLSLYCEMLPRAITAGGVDPTRQAIGTGPYRFTEWIPHQRMVMDFVDRPHFSGQPKVRRLVWRPVPEAATRLVELKTGEDLGHRQRVGDVRLAGAAELAGVGARGELVGPANQREIGSGEGMPEDRFYLLPRWRAHHRRSGYVRLCVRRNVRRRFLRHRHRHVLGALHRADVSGRPRQADRSIPVTIPFAVLAVNCVPGRCGVPRRWLGRSSAGWAGVGSQGHVASSGAA